MGVGLINLRLEEQSIYAESNISKIVEKSSGYLALRLTLGANWQDCTGISIYCFHENGTEKTVTEGVYHGELGALPLIPWEVIETPGFGLYVVGKGADFTITTAPIYFKVSFTGNKHTISGGGEPLATVAAAIETNNKVRLDILEPEVTQLKKGIEGFNNDIDFLETSFNSLKNNVNTTIQDSEKRIQKALEENLDDVDKKLTDFRDDYFVPLEGAIDDFKEDISKDIQDFKGDVNTSLDNSASYLQTLDLKSTEWLKVDNQNKWYQVIPGIPFDSKIDIQLDKDNLYDLFISGLTFWAENTIKSYDFSTETGTNEVRIYCIEKKPIQTYTVQLEITKLKNINSARTIKGLPIGQYIDWNQDTIYNKPETTSENDVFSIDINDGVCSIILNKELYYEEKEV